MTVWIKGKTRNYIHAIGKYILSCIPPESMIPIQIDNEKGKL